MTAYEKLKAALDEMERLQKEMLRDLEEASTILGLHSEEKGAE